MMITFYLHERWWNLRVGRGGGVNRWKRIGRLVEQVNTDTFLLVGRVGRWVGGWMGGGEPIGKSPPLAPPPTPK